MSKLSACDREWKSRRDDDGSIHLELWDNFLDEWQIVGTVVKDENGFTGQVFDHRPFTFTKQKAVKSWVDKCYVAARFKVYNI